MPKQGDIVLIPVPFTDLSSTKRRPVIVVSNDNYTLDQSLSVKTFGRVNDHILARLHALLQVLTARHPTTK